MKVHSWFTVIQHFSRKWKPQVLEQGLCPVSMSFILALGFLRRSFILPISCLTYNFISTGIMWNYQLLKLWSHMVQLIIDVMVTWAGFLQIASLPHYYKVKTNSRQRYLFKKSVNNREVEPELFEKNLPIMQKRGSSWLVDDLRSSW